MNFLNRRRMPWADPRFQPLNTPSSFPRWSQPPVPVARQFEVTGETGPLDSLSGRDVLVVADVQNLNASAGRLGFRVRWDELARRLRQAAARLRLHAFLSATPGNGYRAAEFDNAGWTPHVKVDRVVQSVQGPERASNADMLIAFGAGVLASRCTSDVLICSGDGALAEDVAEALRALPAVRGTRRVMTLSVAGSTARRIDCRVSPFIDANLELGLDCMCH